MWQNKYIGIPYKDYGRDSTGIDCWGLACLVYQEEFNITLPSFSEPDTYNADDRSEIAQIIAQNIEGWTVVQTPEPGNLVLFRIMGQPSHVGIAVSATHFIHAMEGHACAIEAFESINWKHRCVGFYKYTSQANVNNLVAVPHPLRTQKVIMNVAYGSTLQQVYASVNEQHNISDRLKKQITILKNSMVIPQSEWSTTVVQHGDTLEYRAVPGKDVGRLVLTLLVIYIAVQTGMYFGGTEATIFGTGVGTATASQAAMITSGAMMAGTMLVNAIMPIRPPEQPGDPGSAKAQLMFSGGPNKANPYSTIPFVLGKMRVTPPLGAQNFVRFGELTTGIIESADASYLDMLLVWGYGPLQIDESTMRIGEISVYDYSTTPPTSNFEKLRYITLDRKTTTSEIQQLEFDAIYGKDVEQVNKGVELTCTGLPPTPAGQTWIPSTTPGPWIEAGFANACDKVSVALHFPQGLRSIKVQGSGAGSSNAAPVSITIEFRTASISDWIPWTTQVIGGTLGTGQPIQTDIDSEGNPIYSGGYANTITGGAAKKDAFTWTITKDRVTSGIAAWSPTEALQVRVRRNTGDNTEPNDSYRYSHTVIFQNATAISNNSPAVDPKYSKIAKTALTIQATDQLSNQMDGVNAIVQTWCLNWNGTAWIEAATNNPASLFRYVLQSPANPQRILDADVNTKIDLAQLQYWHTFCNQTRTDPQTGETYKFEFNDIIASQRSVLDILRDICAAGKASPALIDGRWTVVIDEPRPQVIQHFSPHNSWGFESVKVLPKFPDALKVQFYDQDKDYEQRELIIPFAGKTVASSELFETIQLPGVTKAALARDHARWHMAQTKLRPEIYTLNSDIEYLVCNRGDRVKVTHDVPMWGLGSGRIKNRLSTTQFELDEQLSFDAGVTYTIRIRSNTGASTTRNIVPKTQDGYYSSITLSSAVTLAEVNSGDLFLFGELNQEAQDLIVLNIEPGNNKTAKLTLVDYGVTDTYNIFTDYLTYSNSNIFESQVTVPTKLLFNSFGEKKPTITDMISDVTTMQEIAPGVFEYNLQVSFTNDTELPITTSHVEGQIDYESATDNLGIRSISTEFNKGSLQFSNVDVQEVYRTRLRYVGSDGRTGQWTEWQNHTVVGKVQNFQIVNQITVVRAKRNLIITPYIAVVPNDFKSFEVRVWQNSGTGDFWNTVNSGIKIYSGIGAISVDLKDFASPRLSEAGVRYRIACRALDNAGNYSISSTLGAIIIKTISP